MKVWKKRLISGVLCAVMGVGLLTGCGQRADGGPASASASGTASGGSASAVQEQPVMPEGFPQDFVFHSGTGAWQTEMTVQPDGAFIGIYRDEDMGDIGPGYPDGTMYVSRFQGRFDCVERRDDHSYTMKLAALEWEQTQTEWLEDGMRCITAQPYGVEQGTDFVLYLPGTPVEGLDEEFLSWWPGRFAETPMEKLEGFAIWNVETGYGFFS